MAVDTRRKRMSMMSMGRPFITGVPEPDGMIALTDRFRLIYRYAFQLTAPVLAAIICYKAQITELGRPCASLESCTD